MGGGGSMGLLDTLPTDLVDGGLDDLDAGSAELLSTVAELPPDEETGHSFADASLHFAQPAAPTARSSSASANATESAQAAGTKPKRTRKKKDPFAPAQTRSEICRNAAKRRWAQTHAAEASSVEGTVSIRCQDVHIPDSHMNVLVASSASESCAEIVAAMGDVEQKYKGATERHVFVASKHLTSTLAISRVLKIDRMTVRRKMRLMAAAIVFGLKHRMWLAVKSAHSFLQDRCWDFEACQHVLGQRYDEMQIALKVTEIPPDMPLWLSKANGKSRVFAKLMQVLTQHSFLFRCNGAHLAIVAEPPTLIKPIESTHAQCVLAALKSQEAGNDWARSAFTDSGRITGADNHSSNASSDFKQFQLDWESGYVRTLLRWVCQVHAGHKVAEVSWQAYLSDLRGIMASTMMLRVPGNQSKWKRGCEIWIDHKVTRIPSSEATPDPIAEEFRRQVFAKFAHGEDSRLTGPKAATRRKSLLRKRKLYSSDVRLLNTIPHRCDGCCDNVDDTKRQMKEDLQQTLFPEAWAENRWLGSEEAADWHMLWLSLHGLYVAGYLIGIRGMTDLEKVERTMELVLRSTVWAAQDGADPNFEETHAEMTQFERATTYIKNVELWLNTLPSSRLWMVKSSNSIQQTDQKERIFLGGEEWERQQKEAALLGKPRKYRPLVAHDHEITDKTMKRIGEALTGTEFWTFLPEECQIHSIAMAGFRSHAKMACTYEELFNVRERKYPAKYFASFRDNAEKALEAATITVDDFERRPCTMDHWSHHHTSKYPTAAAFVSAEHRAKQELAMMMSYIDNAPVESNNASIRRHIKSRVQVQTPELQDIQAEWVSKQARQQRRCVFGAASSAPDGGGGGDSDSSCGSESGGMTCEEEAEADAELGLLLIATSLGGLTTKSTLPKLPHPTRLRWRTRSLRRCELPPWPAGPRPGRQGSAGITVPQTTIGASLGRSVPELSAESLSSQSSRPSLMIWMSANERLPLSLAKGDVSWLC